MPRSLTNGVRRLFKMPQADIGDQYSVWVGLIYIFNLIVGTGALTLPAAFANAGWGLGLISIIVLAFMSYLNATYVLESMACANAILKWKKLQSLKRESIQEGDGAESSDEPTPMQNEYTHLDSEEPLVTFSQTSRYYTLDYRIELGEMANIFFNKTGRMMFYITIIVYLYGDLSIYSAAVAKSIMDVVCINVPANMTNGSMPCFNVSEGWEEGIVTTRFDVYRIALLTFMCALGPFVFFNVQKTKYLQLLTTLMRWLAFAIMISFAVHFLVSRGPQGNPPVFEFKGMPMLFGTCVYSFMCHHSLPGLVSPIKGKSSLGTYLALDYIVIIVFYLLLAFTGAFAFANLSELYTLNFVPTDNENIILEIIEYFLALFPVFTLSTSFPIIAITLRDNIQSLFLDMSHVNSYNIVLRRILFPVVAVVPPILLTLFLEDITVLVGFTGSYAGTCIQYLIPTFLVLTARKYCSSLLGLGVVNKHRSPFGNILWAFFVIAWSVMCIVLVSLHFFEKNS